MYFVLIEGYLNTCSEINRIMFLTELNHVSCCIITRVCEILKIKFCVILTLIVYT